MAWMGMPGGVPEKIEKVEKYLVVLAKENSSNYSSAKHAVESAKKLFADRNRGENVDAGAWSVVMEDLDDWALSADMWNNPPEYVGGYDGEMKKNPNWKGNNA